MKGPNLELPTFEKFTDKEKNVFGD